MKHLKLFNSFVNEELNEESLNEAKQEHIKYLQDFITRWDDAQENDRDLKGLEAEYNKKLTQFGLPKMSADELLHQLQSKIKEGSSISKEMVKKLPTGTQQRLLQNIKGNSSLSKIEEDLENENLSEGRNEFLVAKELAKIAKMDVDRADSVVSGFINGTKDLATMRKYWNAKDDKAAAMIVKKYWLDESLNEGVVSIKGGRILAHKVLNKLVDMEIIPVKKKTEDLVEAIASVLATTSMSESLNEAFEVHYSDGVRASKKFGNERQAVEFAKELIKSKKGLQFVDVFDAGSGFHSTADTDAIVAWWGDGSYTDNKSKNDPKLAAKKIDESEVNEGMVQIAGKNKPSGAKVLATIIVDDLMKKDYLKPGADKVKSYLVDDVQDVIMNNTF